MNTFGKKGALAVMGLLAGTAATTAILVSTDTAGAVPATPRHDQVSVTQTSRDGKAGPVKNGTAVKVGSPRGDSNDPVTVTPVDHPGQSGPIREGTAVPVGDPDTGNSTGGIQITLPANG